MKGAITVAIVAAVTLSVSAQHGEPMAGTWNLNAAKSHYSPGPAPQSQITVFEAIPNGLKAVSTTVRDGVASRIVTTFLFDGKEYEIEGAPVKTTRTYTRKGERRLEWTERQNGQVTTKTVCEVSADGNTRMVTTTGRDLKGQVVHNVAVYERER